MLTCQKSQQPCARARLLLLCPRITWLSCARRKIENCKKELTTDLFKHGHVIGMYWENIARSMVERANRDAQDLDVPLFCLQAADQRHSRKNKAIDKQLTHQLLSVPNPHRTGKLQGMLLVHENMVVRLADVLAPHLGLVKDKTGSGSESGFAP